MSSASPQAHHASPETSATPARRRFRLTPGVLWMLFDLIVPTALFYVAIGMGIGLYWALLASAGFSAVTGLVSWLRGDRREAAIYMLLVSLLSVAIAFVSGSDRFLLARESVITAMAGGWFFWSLRAERPLTYRLTRPLLQGRMQMIDDWERVWTTNARFRHIWRVSTIMWGVATLLDAVLRVVIAYSMPISWVPLMQTGLMLATVLLMQVVTNGYYLRVGMWTMIHKHTHGELVG